MDKLLLLLLLALPLYSQNQTATVNIPLPETTLPYRLKIEKADFYLPQGLQSVVFAKYQGEWLMLAGRTNGLHFVDNTNPADNPFPSKKQNTTIFVVNPVTKKTYSRSLLDTNLTQEQIDLLSVTNAQSYQALEGKTLYMIGGYGIDSATGEMTTKSYLTAFDVPKLIKWVKGGKGEITECFRQVSNPLLKVTGGLLWQANTHQPYLLSLGQNFEGNYLVTSNGEYTKQIRPFQIVDTGREIYVYPFKQSVPLETYRRRDLNIVPIIKKRGNTLVQAYSVLSGVFTPGPNGGAWTVPIEINADGSSFMPNPNDPATLKQGMNAYACANFGLYSPRRDNMFVVLLGGMSYLILSDGNPNSCNANPPPSGDVFTECPFLPFVNDVTTVRIDAKGRYQQYLMSAKYPTIIADFGSGKGGPIWYGASATFFLAEDLPLFSNEVINFDKLGDGPVLLGYIMGGIASSVTFTNFPGDTQASRYVFKVYLHKTDKRCK